MSLAWMPRPALRRMIVCLLTVMTLPVISGCQWVQWLQGPPVVVTPPPPTVFLANVSLPDVLFAVNTNSQKNNQMQSDSVQLTVRGFRLSGSLAVQTPRNFRLQAGLSRFTGQDLDIGSNQNQMWFWTKWHPEPAVYHVQHHQFETSAARQLIPVHPKFLIEALGVVYLDPKGIHEGPFQVGDNRLQIRSIVRSAQTGEEMVRVTILDNKYGWILEQVLQDSRGQILAKSVSQEHRFYEDHGVSLPHRIDITLGPGQPNEMAFHMKVNQYNLNSLMGNPEQLWSKPNIGGAPHVDLANPHGSAPNRPSASQLGPTASRPVQPIF